MYSGCCSQMINWEFFKNLKIVWEFCFLEIWINWMRTIRMKESTKWLTVCQEKEWKLQGTYKPVITSSHHDKKPNEYKITQLRYLLPLIPFDSKENLFVYLGPKNTNDSTQIDPNPNIWLTWAEANFRFFFPKTKIYHSKKNPEFSRESNEGCCQINSKL